MNRPRITAAAIAACLTGAVILAAAPPASAGSPILANGHVYITYTATTFTACASGNVDDGTGIDGLWLFTVDGARTDATPIVATNPASGESYSQCVTVQKNATADGGFVATLWFATVGTSSPNILPDFTAVAVGVGTWNPNGGASLGT